MATTSDDQRKLIGQAIIDGILTPHEVVVPFGLDYVQGQGDYKQRGGGSHTQGPGNYDQAKIQTQT